jgi:hypothetical protein
MNKKQLIVAWVIGALLLSGCATIDSVNKNYQKINYSDGINTEEAKLIGKKRLINSGYQSEYQVISPDFLIDKRTKKYPDYWFVVYHPKNLGLTHSKYLVVMNKKTGDVLYSDYWECKENNFDWIIDKKGVADRYFLGVKRKIYYHVNTNYKASEEGIVFVRFNVLKDGTLKDVEVDRNKTKAAENLINVAVQAVRDSFPFFPFPTELQRFPELPFRLGISFETDNSPQQKK